ncbi:MAG: hypothetical protein QF491_14975, partial [Alphaproteobacteria bacterium]|nr:hypothetical protein [Alphaproteobacteria bacterium]
KQRHVHPPFPGIATTAEHLGNGQSAPQCPLWDRMGYHGILWASMDKDRKKPSIQSHHQIQTSVIELPDGGMRRTIPTSPAKA